MTLTKSDIVESIYNQCGLSKTKSDKLVETVLETMKGCLESGEDVLLSGFGKFCVKGKNERRGRNPATGRDLILEPRRVVTFHVSPVFKGKLNRKR